MCNCYTFKSEDWKTQDVTVLQLFYEIETQCKNKNLVKFNIPQEFLSNFDNKDDLSWVINLLDMCNHTLSKIQGSRVTILKSGEFASVKMSDRIERSCVQILFIHLMRLLLDFSSTFYASAIKVNADNKIDSYGLLEKKFVDDLKKIGMSDKAKDFIDTFYNTSNIIKHRREGLNDWISIDDNPCFFIYTNKDRGYKYPSSKQTFNDTAAAIYAFFILAISYKPSII